MRSLKPGGIFFVVVPDYLKERQFFWDIDYTHNFVTTERRVKQLFNDGGFEILHVERAIGLATGVKRDLLGAAAVFINIPGVDARSRYTGTKICLQDPQASFETLDIRRGKPSNFAMIARSASPGYFVWPSSAGGRCDSNRVTAVILTILARK